MGIGEHVHQGLQYRYKQIEKSGVNLIGQRVQSFIILTVISRAIESESGTSSLSHNTRETANYEKVWPRIKMRSITAVT
jgi:hypothetical protein